MAIPDLLWACPECGEDRGLTASGSRARCRECGTIYRRDRGAAIRADHPDGTQSVLAPQEWLDRLPTAETIVREQLGPLAPGEGPGSALVREARASMRSAVDTEPVHGETGYLNRIEIWGEPEDGIVELYADRLVFSPESARAGGHAGGDGHDGDDGNDGVSSARTSGPSVWPLEDLRAVQASSSSLQLNGLGTPLVAFRFAGDSVFLWENLLHAALRRFYRATDRGEIQEFQPRIVAL